MTQLLPWISLAVVSISLALSVASYVRSGRWKDGEDATRLIARVGTCEGEITTLKTQMLSVATKADVAALTEKLNGVKDHTQTIERGVERIEMLLMRETA